MIWLRLFDCDSLIVCLRGFGCADATGDALYYANVGLAIVADLISKCWMVYGAY